MSNRPIATILAIVAIAVSTASLISERSKPKAVTEEPTPVVMPVESIKIIGVETAKMKWLEKEVIPKKTTAQIQWQHCVDVIQRGAPEKEAVELCDLRKSAALKTILTLDEWIIKQETK